MARRRRSDDAIGTLLREWGALARLEAEGKAVEWPSHQLPVTLAVMRMKPAQRHALECQFASPPDQRYLERADLAGVSTTTFAKTTSAARSFIEGYLSAAAERAG